MTSTVVSLPVAPGILHQTSQVFSKHGYDPKKGVVAAVGASVTDSRHRLVYARPMQDSLPFEGGAWGMVTYTASDGLDESSPGTVYIVPPGGGLLGSSFTLDTNGWQVCQNGGDFCTPATHDPTSRGSMRQFIRGDDTVIRNLGLEDGDPFRWYFSAPPTWSGNWGVAYGGKLTFTLEAFAGDFTTQATNGNGQLIQLTCEQCDGNRGILLAFPVSIQHLTELTVGPLQINLDLIESAGWIKDPQNPLLEWLPPSKCEFIQVISNLSNLRILGDFTRHYESLRLDAVSITQMTNRLPICAQITPDALNCSCSG